MQSGFLARVQSRLMVAKSDSEMEEARIRETVLC
jgi:hypothetical protein